MTPFNRFYRFLLDRTSEKPLAMQKDPKSQITSGLIYLLGIIRTDADSRRIHPA